MNIWEILLTAAGLSLDVYAVCICKGAVIGRIDGKKLTQMCIVFFGMAGVRPSGGESVYSGS